MQKWNRASVMNLASLSTATKPQVLAARDQNLLNLQTMVTKLHTPTLLADVQSSCTDTDDGVFDSGMDGCKWYEKGSTYCGDYDDNDFVASTHCCACGGGVTQEQVDAVMDDFAVGLEDLLIDHSEAPEPWIDGAVNDDGPEPLILAAAYQDGPLPMREIQDLIGGLNQIGRDPQGFLDEMR